MNENTSAECKDLIIVVPNKYVLDEPVEKEPYPFRSEIPSSSSTAERKTVDFLLPQPRVKKLRHPLKISSIDRSKSTPNLFFTSSSSTPTTDHHRSLKIFRQWFGSSSLGRFIQSFTKQHSNKSVSSPSNYADLIY